VKNIKIMRPSHDMWYMKFGSYKHFPIRAYYAKGSAKYILYYNFEAPSGTTLSKCKKNKKCGEMNKWYYIKGAKTSTTQGKNGKSISINKRVWVDIPLKVAYSKKKGKYVIRLECSKCAKG